MPLDAHRRQELERCMRAVTVAAGDIGLFCDRTEHAEAVDASLVAAASERLCKAALDTARTLELDLFAIYADRLDEVEGRPAVRPAGAIDGGTAARAAKTWSALQAVQAAHDRDYHLDVVGLSRLDQLRHCSFHAAKLAAWYARILEDESHFIEFRTRRLPDTLLFGLKFATLAGVPLASSPLDGAPDERSRPDAVPRVISLRG